MEANPKKYFRMVKNVINDDATALKAGQDAAKKLGLGARISSSLLVRLGKFMIMALAFTSVVKVWNKLMHGDKEERLPVAVQGRSHVILGEDKSTGEIYYFDRLGAFADVLDWVSLDTAAMDVKDFMNGRLTLKEYATQIVQSPINKLVNASYPFHKLAAELLMGKSLFPNAFDARPIRDVGLHLAMSFGLDREYKAVFGLPQRNGSYLDSLKDLVVYRSDPGEAAYWDIMSLKNNFEKQEGKVQSYTVTQTPKSRALYNYKLSIRYKDKKAADKYIVEYALQGGTSKGLKTSLKMMSPLYGLDSKEQDRFIKSLSVTEKERLVMAVEFYSAMLRPLEEENDSVPFK